MGPAAATAAGLTIADDGASYPDGTEFGVRWNHIGRWLEHSVSAFRGFDHLPLITVTPRPDLAGVAVRREYAQLTAVGGDLAAPLPWFTLKAEAAWLGSDTVRRRSSCSMSSRPSGRSANGCSSSATPANT